MSNDPKPEGRDRERSERRAAQDAILVEALAEGRSYREAGALAGVVARTVQRRMAEPEFAARVSRRRSEFVAAATGQLVSLSNQAVEVLEEILHGGQRESDRLRAASIVLSSGLRFHNEHELTQLLRRIEQRFKISDEDPFAQGSPS